MDYLDRIKQAAQRVAYEITDSTGYQVGRDIIKDPKAAAGGLVLAIGLALPTSAKAFDWSNVFKAAQAGKNHLYANSKSLTGGQRSFTLERKSDLASLASKQCVVDQHRRELTFDDVMNAGASTRITVDYTLPGCQIDIGGAGGTGGGPGTGGSGPNGRGGEAGKDGGPN